jgi:hypothetical protein
MSRITVKDTMKLFTYWLSRKNMFTGNNRYKRHFLLFQTDSHNYKIIGILK